MNARGLKDRSEGFRLLLDLESLGIDVAANEETHFATLVTVCCLAFSMSSQYMVIETREVFPCYCSRKPLM